MSKSAEYDRSIHSNPNAVAWAAFFLKTLREQDWKIEDITEDLMIGWFSNAMMAMHDAGPVRRPTMQEALEIATRCWCTPGTMKIELNTRLVLAFANVLANGETR